MTWDRAARAGAGEYFITAFLGGSTLGAQFIQPSPVPWTGRDGFDEAWRNLARASTPGGRAAADTASSLLIGVGLGGQAAADLIVAGALDREAPATCSAAWQMAFMDAQALGLTGLTQGVVSHGASRERPYGRLCSGEASLPDGSTCAGADRYRSFFSGHTSFSFTLAGLVCMHHTLPLYGGGAGDVAACGLALGTAATVGVLRTVADKHYATDVLTGAAVGTLFGFGVPLLYYRSPIVPAVSWGGENGGRATFVPGPRGGSLLGTF